MKRCGHDCKVASAARRDSYNENESMHQINNKSSITSYTSK